MLRFTLEETKHFRNMVSVLDIMGFPDMTLICTREKIEYAQMEQTHSCACVSVIRVDQCESYVFPHDKKVVQFTLHIESLLTLIRTLDDSDHFTFQWNETNPDVVVISGRNDDDTRRSDVTVKLVLMETEAQEVPEVVFDATIRMKAERFRKEITNIAELGEECSMGCDGKCIILLVNGEIGSSAFRIADNPQFDVKIKKRSDDLCRLTFITKSLVNLSKGSLVAPKGYVTIGLGRDKPLMLDFEGEVVRMTFYLAAKTIVDEKTEKDVFND